jgi:hypothetical protein
MYVRCQCLAAQLKYCLEAPLRELYNYAQRYARQQDLFGTATYLTVGSKHADKRKKAWCQVTVAAQQLLLTCHNRDTPMSWLQMGGQ